jgi:hypothetical protein
MGVCGRARRLHALRLTIKKFAGDDNAIIDLPSPRVGKPLN